MHIGAVLIIMLAFAPALAAGAASSAADGANVHHGPRFIAHRGLAQAYSRESLDRDTCTAGRILPPRHGFLENTVASIRAAFDAGAEIVEVDIQPTRDGEFVLFHDWTLDCRTDGHGVTREQTLAYLRSLDIGYGYTADAGRTFPFRGRFVGAMPTLAEAVAAFPGRRFLVNIKSNDPREGEWIAAYVESRGFDRSKLAFYGGDRPVSVLRGRWPQVQTMSRATLKACAWQHVLIGWTGHVPDPCRHSILFVPLNYQHWLWGWPGRFVARMNAAGTDVAIVGPYEPGNNESGHSDTVAIDVDDPSDLDRIASGYAGLVVTGRIDAMGGRR